MSNEYAWFWDRLDDYLKAHDLKQTSQRNIIVSKFLSMEKHVDIESLHSELRNNGENIGLATIYRTMNLLKNASLVEQHNFSDNKATFEVSHPHKHHDHLVCLICSKVEEFVNNEIEALQDSIAKERGFKLLDHRLELFGYCSECQAE
jgi:Fur family ferric uptake transcriptional regulator